MITMKDFLVFTVGMGVGGAVTYLFIKEEFKQMAEEEIESMHDYYQERINDVKNRRGKVSEKPPLETLVEDSKKVMSIYKKYDKMFREAEEDCDEEDDEDYEEDDIDEEELTAAPTDDPPEEPYYDNLDKFKKIDKYNNPYIISLDEFNEDMEYDKISLGYYQIDDILVDEGEEVITDVSYVVGDEALTSFGVMSDDRDIVYIRNERLAIDYEIVRMNKSYRETVLGFDDLPPQKMRRVRDED